ncbi:MULTISPECIES: S1-like domain-containing RNA-binding protein [unclassified Parabacteroides]|uniref:CvfB family protein n=1 Tax=unclassified Parabacteroides TaxID=2649774 RepID=UPI002473A3DB|nr:MULTISPECIES: S1-like domain-containing RNA-binding protein [unclassified Parabacteroides]
MKIGKYNTLKIVKDLDFGVYLDGGNGQEILLPARYVPKNVKPGDEVEVFIYHDNEGRLIATTERPLALVGEFRFMTVKSVNDTGAFLEWGLMKDLLVPFREQKTPMQEGRRYLVYVYLDHLSKRIVASSKIDKYIGNTFPSYEFNQQVDLLIADETEIGFRVIINDLHWGLVYYSEVFRSLEKGERLKGYIKEVREDEKIDVSLTPLGYGKVEGVAGKILESLRIHGGFLPLHDKSDPEEIYALFHCSKKAFKQAIGTLYKQKLIIIEEKGIRISD